jgi:polyisoprenoid-binding protein YceI
MKNFGIVAIIFAFIGLSFTNPTSIETFEVDTTASQVAWTGYKVTGEHNGVINVKSGELQFEDGVWTGGNFEIDMTTLKVTDLEGGMATKLEGHLKSPDFFGIEKFPTASFEITKVVSRGTAGSYKVTGDLTIKDTTKEIKFQTTLSEDGKTADAKITVDRSDFNVKYGSGSFFDGLGDKTIYDEFDLNVTLVVK